MNQRSAKKILNNKFLCLCIFNLSQIQINSFYQILTLKNYNIKLSTYKQKETLLLSAVKIMMYLPLAV